MPWAWVPLVGIAVFFAVGLWWRPWLHQRRYGSSGLFMFRSGRRSQDVRDALALVLILALVVQAAVSPSLISSPAWRVLGLLLLLGGIILLVVGQLALGASWRVGIEEGAKPGLVTDGIYRWSRNPIFLAFLAAVAGYAVLLPTPLSFLLWAAFYAGVRAQIRSEEEYLLRTYGEAFRAYARGVGRLILGVGRYRGS